MRNLPPWRQSLARALHRHRNQPQSRYLQLATVTPQGFPTNRTVVFRGFWQETNQFKFITDARSEKVSHLKACPYAEACWYFEKTREQFRISGKVVLINADQSSERLLKARQQSWQTISDNARSQFAWPEPGQPRSDNPPEEFALDLSPTIPLANFCLMLLLPERVDHLSLTGNPHERWLHQLQNDQSWQAQRLNP